MANTSINIRMDKELKLQFEKLCEDMGMTMSAAINIFVEKAVREYRIPFEVGTEIPNSETQKAIMEVQQMKKDYALGRTYTDVDEMIKNLLA